MLHGGEGLPVFRPKSGWGATYYPENGYSRTYELRPSGTPFFFVDLLAMSGRNVIAKRQTQSREKKGVLIEGALAQL